MRKLILLFLACAALAGAQSRQTFSGVVTDSMCGKNHAMMKVSPDAKCVVECVKAGSQYALYDGRNVYVLSDQKTPERFAGQRVKITGVLYEKTKILKVDSISVEGQAAHQH